MEWSILKSIHPSWRSLPIFVTLLGQVISADEVEFSIVPGLQLLGCPFTAWVDLAQEDWVGQGARAAAVPQLADQLTFFVDGAYQSYALKQADGKWHMVSPIVVFRT